MTEFQRQRRAIGETDRQLDDDRLAESDLRLRLPIEAGHRDQRVTGADLQAVREMVDFTVSEPVQVRDMPSVGLRAPLIARESPPRTTRETLMGQADAMAALAKSERKESALPPVGARVHVRVGGYLSTGTIAAHEVSALGTRARVICDSGSRIWAAPGQAAVITEQTTPTSEPTWRQTAENLRDALALVTKERDEARLARDANAQELASALCSIRRFEKLFDDAGQGEYNVLALVDHYAAQAAAGQDAQRIMGELRALLSVENDGPEGAMSPSWVLGQVRQVLGLHEESDAETLDLSGPGIEEGEPERETTAAEDVRTVVAARRKRS